MSDDSSFDDLIRRVRAGDELAATELVRQYEPAIRLAVRVRLGDSALRRLFDSMDICQSVLANFFVRAAAGQFELDKPGQLLKLLVTMARNKVTNHAMQQQAARRDYRKVDHAVEEQDCIDPRGRVSQVVANRELLVEFRNRLSPQDQQLVDLRSAGQSWEEIACELKANPDALRLHFSRVVDRVVREMKLDE